MSMITIAFALMQAAPIVDGGAAGKALAALRAAPVEAIRTARQAGAIVRDRLARPEVRIVRTEGDLVLIAFGAAEVWIPASAFQVTDLGLQVPLSIEDVEAGRGAQAREGVAAATD